MKYSTKGKTIDKIFIIGKGKNDKRQILSINCFYLDGDVLSMKLIITMAFMVVLFLLSGCSTPSKDNSLPNKSNETLKNTNSSVYNKNPISSYNTADMAQNLNPEKVLNRASFQGGMLGDKKFHGGQVLLWYSEENLLTVRASLELDNGRWRSTNVTAHLVTVKDVPFGVSAAILNDAEDDERKVPLWVFWGYSNDPKIKSIRVANLPGIPIIENDVQNNTWLAIFQGILSDRLADLTAEYEALDENWHVLYTQEQKL